MLPTGEGTSGARAWISFRLAEGYSQLEIAKALQLSQLGESDDWVTKTIRELATDELILVAAELNYKWRKMQALTASLWESASSLGEQILPWPDDVPRREHPDLLSACNKQSIPVVMAGIFTEWHSAGRIDWNWIRDRFGDLAIKVSPSRMSSSPYAVATHDQFYEVSLGDYLDGILNGNTDFYAVARSNLLARPEFTELRDRLTPVSGVNDRPAPRASQSGMQLWIGPTGSLTSLHHDARSVVLAQVIGTKRVALVPPSEYRVVDTDNYCFSRIRGTVEQVQERAVQDGFRCYAVDLGPGDGLLIPVGWWHVVEATSPSVSVTLQNLNVPSYWEQAYLGEPGDRVQGLRIPPLATPSDDDLNLVLPPLL